MSRPNFSFPLNRGLKVWAVAEIFPVIITLASAGVAWADSRVASRFVLKNGWAIQSSARVQEKGDVVSTTQFKPKGWYPTSVPSTVLAALVQNKVFPDPYFGMNLRSIPGATYPIGENFSHSPMPSDSPFRSSWWYRTEFRLPLSYRGKQVWLNFEGINYRLNVWLNGHQIASSGEVAGTFRTYEVSVSDAVLPRKINTLAVEVFAPEPDDLALTWVDWNPAPPDKNMGIWRNVYLRASGPVTLRDPQVITGLDLPLLDTARLAVTAELHNTSKRQVKGILKGRIAGIQFSQSVELASGEKKLVTFSPDQFPQLKLSHPRLWWPAELGTPNLYTLHIEFNSGGKLSDGDTLQFGIREISSELNEKGAREFKINGERILIRGGGWAPDMLLRPAPESDEVQMRYVLDLGLNTVRLEGKLESDHFFELADRYGILVMAGWCCCDHWEHWDKWKKEDYEIAAESLRSQIRRLRNHPSLLVWLNGSDNPPPPEVEQMYVGILKALHWPNPYLSSATEKPTTVTGPTGVKMTGPYEWVPPSYWLTDTTLGGAWAFNTETSPGPAVPTMQSLRKILPEDRLWPIDEYWNFHAGGGHFKTLDVFTAALNARYGMATGVEDYALKAQAMTYEGNRAMFEAYARNKYVSTGVIQWMLNNAWPSLIWHLYDYFLVPGGGYFGTKKACEPLHVQYSYDDRSVVLVNEKRRPFHKLSLTATVYTLDMAVKFSREVALDVLPDSSTRVFLIPQLEGLTPTFFLNLMLRDAAGSLISSNFYWLSTKPDLLDWAKSKDYADVHGLGYAPAISYADFTGLQTLPKVRVGLSASLKREGGEDVVRVKLSNPSPHLAFFVHLRITKDAGGDDVLPVFWDDNYISLLPGETRQLAAKYRTEHVHGRHLVVEAEGWNIVPSRLDLRR